MRRTVFYVVPETNPDGVRGGYSRSTAQGVNLEINWDRPDSLTQPEVRVLKRTIDSLSTERPFDVALNLHSQSAPFVTYWIHTAKSTSAKMYRRKMLLSALTVAHTPYYRPIDQRFFGSCSPVCRGLVLAALRRENAGRDVRNALYLL